MHFVPDLSERFASTHWCFFAWACVIFRFSGGSGVGAAPAWGVYSSSLISSPSALGAFSRIVRAAPVMHGLPLGLPRLLGRPRGVEVPEDLVPFDLPRPRLTGVGATSYFYIPSGSTSSSSSPAGWFCASLPNSLSASIWSFSFSFSRAWLGLGV
ncbi:hypothetical protein P691DRAFT_504689 [Macrolepiota fuliginosa MF-IS2]|uniref:Uncharacterized protein n=1 Tax=Macrolepiota fuliginosa MF-IS2 TaxID=1400762 RepID=A0A9P5XER1_9AGAR|nr:hypothetical protein P691DRAFT_504689 [Macrolepiota fuliginosa MF-IS2]